MTILRTWAENNQGKEVVMMRIPSGVTKVVNHRVDDEVIEKVKIDLEEFFKLPLKEKEVFPPLRVGLQGYGQKLGLNEEKQEWSTLDKYLKELKLVSMSLFATIAKNLGLNPQVFNKVFKELQRMRMNYYPPCPKANQVLGINPHSNAGALTIHLQVSDVHGLQIKRNGQWLPVQPLPYALTVNIGNALEDFLVYVKIGVCMGFGVLTHSRSMEFTPCVFVAICLCTGSDQGESRT
ncbi:protein SRG1-like [Dioscorea cayenensis subsp. rotundata]|uniref:Protein SRG1-like n=1 Tax=Dioscorea cayennensis subsp. rotundata TaxID=55577 RepID=A0AB40CKJ4_DIOCR|nr:protein SRG1-like [Dioscorea cayenensis subsp. rotundata]